MRPRARGGSRRPKALVVDVSGTGTAKRVLVGPADGRVEVLRARGA